MSRQKVTEFTAKTALYPTFNLKFTGSAVTVKTTSEELRQHFGDTNLVLKVDQGIKKRGLSGLVKLNLTPADIPGLVKSWAKHGWSNFLVEPMVEHDPSAEQYLALSRTRSGWETIYRRRGGVDIESNWDQVTTKLPPQIEAFISSTLIPQLDLLHISFMEINPLLIRRDQLIPLDLAVEVDSAASTLPTLPDRSLTPSEKMIVQLDNSTPASLKFRLINPNGHIWMLLSGGGASLVLADEVADLGLGSELANYGEYSGAPTDDDVYTYTKIILNQLLSQPISHASLPMAIIIAGGVANFTDVKKTFQGLIRALDEQKTALKKAKVKVFVRRGGPNEESGLSLMRSFLQEAGLLGSVSGHRTPLTQVVTDAKTYLSS